MKDTEYYNALSTWTWKLNDVSEFVFISSSGINFDMGLNLYFCITSSCMSPTKVHSNHTLGWVARASLMLFVAGDAETKCSTSFPLFKLF